MAASSHHVVATIRTASLTSSEPPTTVEAPVLQSAQQVDLPGSNGRL